MPYIQWKDKTIYVLYKCSKCGMYVAKTLSLRKEVSYQTVYGRNQASADSQNRLDSDIRRLKRIDQRDVNVYRAAHLKCKCPYCGHSECWTWKYDSALRVLAIWASLLLGMFFFIAVAAGFELILPFILVSCLVAVIYLLYGIINKKKIQEATEKCMPVFGETVEELKEYAAGQLIYQGICWDDLMIWP